MTATPSAPGEHIAEDLGLVIDGLLGGDREKADVAYERLTPGPKPAGARRPTMTQAMKKLVFDRDHYQCRYCGRRVILSDVAALLNVIDPERFPWHRNWKDGAIHPAFPLIIASVDHIDPYVGGCPENLDNLATACWPCNSAKSDKTGWSVRDPGDADPAWLGLTDRFRELWVRAGSPKKYRSSVKYWAV